MTKGAKNESKRGRNKQASPQVSLIRHYRLPLLRDPVKIGLLRILKKKSRILLPTLHYGGAQDHEREDTR